MVAVRAVSPVAWAMVAAVGAQLFDGACGERVAMSGCTDGRVSRAGSCGFCGLSGWLRSLARSRIIGNLRSRRCVKTEMLHVKPRHGLAGGVGQSLACGRCNE